MGFIKIVIKLSLDFFGKKEDPLVLGVKIDFQKLKPIGFGVGQIFLTNEFGFDRSNLYKNLWF
jgi:hypothetical protein